MQGDYDCVQYFELVICYPILFCHLGPLQYQIGSSRVENYIQIKKDYSCEMDQAIAPCLAFSCCKCHAPFSTLLAGLRAGSVVG